VEIYCVLVPGVCRLSATGLRTRRVLSTQPVRHVHPMRVVVALSLRTANDSAICYRHPGQAPESAPPSAPVMASSLSPIAAEDLSAPHSAQGPGKVIPGGL
jgi:hypothetical protein